MRVRILQLAEWHTNDHDNNDDNREAMRDAILFHRPAILEMDWNLFTSAIPESGAHADEINLIARKYCEAMNAR